MGVEEIAKRAAAVLPKGVRPRTRLARLLTFGIGLALAVVLVLTVVEAAFDYFGVSTDPRALASQFNERPHVIGVGLIALEEAGVPLPISGDVIIMFSAAHVSRQIYSLAALWAAFETAVAVGSSVLFLIARRWGRRLLEGPVGYALHLTPERMRSAEGWFRRWGIWAVIFGRHVPGFRVAITVVAASFNMRYPVFLSGVLISAGVWLVFFIGLGAALGPRTRRLISAHQDTSLILLGGVVALGVLYVTARLLWRRFRPAASRPP